MPPKVATENTDADAPRRSARVAAQPKEEVKAKPARKVSNAKKRVAEADADDATTETSKKVKSTQEEGDQDESEVGTASEAPAPIDIGGTLPAVTLKNEKGEDVEVSQLAAEKGVILFLVPKADTPGCTTQACGFRDIYPDFTSLNYDVYCLSADTPTAQNKWQTKKSLPYPLLSDPKRILITALGAGDGGKTKRSHFIFEKGGILVDKKVPVKPVDSPKLALEFIQSRTS